MKSIIKDKFYALLVHLGISAIIALLSLMVVFYVWYPAPLHEAVGVTNIFLILLGVDITIGPLFTFIVYKKGKKSLTFDLTVIALMQVAALVYGMHTVFIGRPAFVVYSVDRFEVSRAYEIDPKSMALAEKNKNEIASISWLKPKWVGAQSPKDHDRRNEILFASVMGGNDWPQLPELFVPLAEVKEQILKRARPLADLRKFREQEKAALETLKQWKDDEVKWLPLVSNAKNMTVLVDAKTAAVVRIIDVNPWQ